MKSWPRQDLHPDAYRALVEGAPAILYIDRPDELSTNLYTSPQIVELLGDGPRNGRRMRSSGSGPSMEPAGPGSG